MVQKEQLGSLVQQPLRSKVSFVVGPKQAKGLIVDMQAALEPHRLEVIQQGPLFSNGLYEPI